jgi:hypothetical protein
MRIKAASALILAAALAAPAFGQSFLGEWTATAETGGGSVSETVTVVETDDGYAITAELVGAAPGTPTAGPGADIVIDGDRFSYTRAVSMGPGSELVISYRGVVSGDAFTGTANMMGTEIPYNGVRVAADD